MQIIINIPEKVNNRLRSVLGHGYCLRNEDVKVIAEAVYNGQPERKKGKWIERSVDVDGKKSIEEWQSAKCSVCGLYHTTPYLYYFDDFNFCPNCGAKMEEQG